MTRTRRTKRRIRLIQRYFTTYGRYPRFTRGNLTVEACQGYIIVKDSAHPIYIPKKQLIELIRWLVPLIKEMGPSHDPDAAMSDYLAWLTDHEKELRRQKKEWYRSS